MEIDWKSGLEQYDFHMYKKPLSKLFPNKALSKYIVHLDINDKVGLSIISIDMLQMDFVNMIILMMMWVVDTINLEVDIANYSFSVPYETDYYTFELSFNMLYNEEHYYDYKDSEWYDASSEMGRDIYLDVIKSSLMCQTQKILLLRIPVSLCDLYLLIDNSLEFVSDAHLSATVLHQIDEMYKTIQKEIIL